MEESKSPVLKSNKDSNVHLLTSPIIANRGKRQKRVPDSPVFFSSTRRTTRRCNRREESPVIDNFWSPPSNKNSSASYCRLKPKSLFVDETPLIVDLSPPDSQTTIACSQTFIEEDSQSDQGCEDDELVIHEKTLSLDSEDINLVDITVGSSSKSDSSFAISQASSSLYSGISSPDRNVVKIKHVTTGSARKKKQYLSNGLAKQLSRLLVRRESDYRLWRFQQKSATDSSAKNKTGKCLYLKIETVTRIGVHNLAHCRLANGDVNARFSLVFTPGHWERCNVRSGDTVSIYEPWQSMETEGGVTLLLGFNLLRKGIAEVSKLSNDSIGGACSSTSADSIAAVAENRRPSTVTVLQTWSCPNSQGCTCNSTLST